jgi:hypothetical protein
MSNSPTIVLGTICASAVLSVLIILAYVLA